LKGFSKNEFDDFASISSNTDILSTKQIEVLAWKAQMAAEADIAPVALASDRASLKLPIGEPSTHDMSSEFIGNSHSPISDASRSEISGLDASTSKISTPKVSTTKKLTIHARLSQYQEQLQKEWRHTDTVDGAFRRQNIVETRFVCVNLEGDTFSKKLVPVLRAWLPHGNLRRYSRAMSRALRRTSQMISGEVLQYLEEHFMDEKQSATHHAQTPDEKHVIMLVHHFITRDWQLRRNLICIVFDQAGLEDLLAQTEYQRPIIGA
jgi:hypothetical protein